MDLIFENEIETFLDEEKSACNFEVTKHTTVLPYHANLLKQD